MRNPIIRKLEKLLNDKYPVFRPVLVPLRENMYSTETLMDESGLIREKTFDEMGYILDPNGNIQYLTLNSEAELLEMTIKFMKYNV